MLKRPSLLLALLVMLGGSACGDDEAPADSVDAGTEDFDAGSEPDAGAVEVGSPGTELEFAL